MAHWTETSWMNVFTQKHFNDLWKQSTWLAHPGLPWLLNQSRIALYWWCLYHFRKPLKMMYHALAEKQLPGSLKVLFSSVAIAVYLNKELALIIISLKPFFKAIDTDHIVLFCFVFMWNTRCLFVTRYLFVCLNVERNESWHYFLP